MADSSIGSLTAATDLYDSDLLVVEQSATAKKLPGSVLKTFVMGEGGIDRIELNADYTLTIYYTSGRSTTTASVRGPVGPSASVTATEYQGSSSGTVIPTGAWSTAIPSVGGGNFLWTRFTWDNGSYSYVVSRYGNDGQGAPGSATPQMDGSASAGTSAAFSREDHVHPVDTSRAAAANLTHETWTMTTAGGTVTKEVVLWQS